MADLERLDSNIGFAGVAVAPAAAPARAAAKAATRALVGRSVADVERSLILHTLDYCQGNRTHTARMLGISIRTLRNKLSQYTIVDLALHAHPSTYKQRREITGSTPSQPRRARGRMRFDGPRE
jgi:DNA-binding NtrC family response regulator